MNLNQLFHFSAVARTGSYSRAADELGVSQPGIYRSVKRLENECGVPLFERQGKGVFLTKAGRALYECAFQIASLKNVAEETVAAEKGLMSGNVRIGASTSVASDLLPSILTRWMTTYPHVSVSIVVAQSYELQRLLLEHDIDLAIGSGVNWHPGLKKRTIFSDVVEVVCCPGHRLLDRGPVSIRALSGERLVVHPRGGGTRDEIDQIESQQGVRFKVAVEVNRQDVIKRLCAAGLGIAFLPRSVISDEVANSQLAVLSVQGFPLTRLYFLVQHGENVPTPEVRSLLAALDSWVEESEIRGTSNRDFRMTHG